MFVFLKISKTLYRAHNNLSEYLKKNTETNNSDGSYGFTKFMVLQGAGLIDEAGKPVSKAYVERSLHANFIRTSYIPIMLIIIYQ